MNQYKVGQNFRIYQQYSKKQNVNTSIFIKYILKCAFSTICLKQNKLIRGLNLEKLKSERVMIVTLYLNFKCNGKKLKE